eukprot:3940457-Rhodomonas_salina.3
MDLPTQLLPTSASASDVLQVSSYVLSGTRIAYVLRAVRYLRSAWPACCPVLASSISYGTYIVHPGTHSVYDRRAAGYRSSVCFSARDAECGTERAYGGTAGCIDTGC